VGLVCSGGVVRFDWSSQGCLQASSLNLCLHQGVVVLNEPSVLIQFITLIATTSLLVYAMDLLVCCVFFGLYVLSGHSHGWWLVQVDGHHRLVHRSEYQGIDDSCLSNSSIVGILF